MSKADIDLSIFTDLIGTPFKYGGRPGESDALDCYGVVVECGRRVGIHFPIRQFAETHEVVAMLIGLQMDEWERIEKAPGAVVLFKLRGIACHVGFMVDEFRFIHAWEKSGGVVVERIEDWEHRVEGYYRYRGANV